MAPRLIQFEKEQVEKESRKPEIKGEEVKTVDNNQKQQYSEADQLTLGERKSENRKSTKTRNKYE